MSGQDRATYESIDVIVDRAVKKAMGKKWDFLDGKSLAGLIADYISGRIAPVARGRWVDDCCSECGQYVYHGDMRNYCPSCGAKMEVETDDTN